MAETIHYIDRTAARVQVEFSIRAWSAVAAGLREPSQWLTWATTSAALPMGEPALDLSHVPSMARRRLGPLAKMAVVVADDVLHRQSLTDLPMVWASRYGDSDKSLALLRSQAMNEPLSPTAFGLSVHNGVGAQHSILRGMVSNAICVASSDSAPEAGVIEALGLLSDEAAQDVMLVCYDEPLPGEYAPLGETPSAAFAWAVLLTRKHVDLPSFSLSSGVAAATDDCSPPSLPHGLGVLQFLLDSDKPRWTQKRSDGNSAWIWERTHA